MRDLINPAKDHFMIIILRFNELTSKVEVFRKLKITDWFELNEPTKITSLLERIKSESHRIAYNASVGIKPPTEAERKKLE